MSGFESSGRKFTNYSGETLTRNCERFLVETGVPVNVKGFVYLRQAVEAVYMDPSAIRNVVKGLYSDIAKRNGTSASCVERNIRTAITIMQENNTTFSGKHSVFSEIQFKHSLQPRELIALIADRLRRGLKEPIDKTRYYQ